MEQSSSSRFSRGGRSVRGVVAGTARRLTVSVVVSIAVVMLAASCAPRAKRATPARLAELARADALVLDGCYRCLQQAREIYAADQSALRKAFDMTLLLAARAKELGLASEPEVSRARELLKDLSARDKTPQLEAQLSARIDAVESIVGDISGLDSEERLQRDERNEKDATAIAERSTRARQILRQSTTPSVTP